MIGFGHIAEPDFYTHFPAMLPRSSRPRAAWGTGVYPSKQYFDIKMRCLRQRRHRRRWYLKGADNTPYEKIGDEVRSLADEVPFDIPDSWEWVRLGSICEIARGGSPRPIKQYLTDAPDGVNWIKISDSDIGGKYINRTKEKIVPEGVSKSRLVHKGDFLLTNSMSFGRPYILNVDGCIHDGWLVLSGYDGCYEKDFLYYMLSSRFAYYQFCDIVSGAVVKNLNSDKVAAALFPLPPRPEQLRIVKAIENVEPLFSDYDHAERNLTQLGTGFPKALKKSILQEAVQGKLVPQDPSDEPAEALLERIRAEKQRLIKEGKIKKDKHESVIFRRDNSHYEKRGSEEVCIDDEIPFEIPENWAWCRASSLGTMNRGRGIKRTETVAQGCPCIRYGEIYTTYETSFDSAVSFVPDTLDKDCLHFSSGDVVFTLTGENKVDIAKTVAFLGDGQIAAGGDLAFWTHHGMNPLYLVYYMASPYCIELKRRTATGDIIIHISTSKVGDFLVPVPPIKEQNRIVSAIEQLFAVASTL